MDRCKKRICRDKKRTGRESPNCRPFSSLTTASPLSLYPEFGQGQIRPVDKPDSPTPTVGFLDSENDPAIKKQRSEWKSQSQC